MENSIRGVHWLAICALIGVASCLVLCPTATRAETVAIVTDVTGKVLVQGGAAINTITILTDIESDTRLALEGGARLVVIYLQSGDEYSFSGPAQVQFKSSGPQLASGAQPLKRASLLGRSSRNASIKPFGVTQGAMVMRSIPARIKLLNLSGTRTLDTAPEFRWQGVEPGARYQFELNDDTGRSLFEIQVEGVALKLPPTLKLESGADYKWSVSARLADGRRYVNTGSFSIAPADLRTRAEALRPPADAAVAERVTFAIWLAQSRLNDEARKYWKTLSGERPHDARLRALAAE